MQGVALAIALYYIVPRLRSRLGPGFLLPVIGESPWFIQSPTRFMWKSWVRYGGLFKTHLLGFPVFVVGSPALFRSVWTDDDAFDFLAMRLHGDDLSYTVLNGMPYLDAVVKETIRLFPIGIGGFRTAKRDVQQPDPHPAPRVTKPDMDSPGGRTAVARVTVGPTGLPTHMDFEARFDEAFRPERWLDEETRPAAFAGFGGGQHLCLGMNLAYTEAKLLLSLLLRRFDYRLEDPGLLRKASLFPGPRPKRGTDGLLLIPRPLEP
ncbi:Cytochrome P450 52A1 [Tetrabaena socialis]|uniref:Cytochrome P450 52A1 n=1 Tax=Tetrabaena socialis TaxID=47790 RepID=A0A2J8A2S7_9CHLO|nr:Cytochrome P450 52A1 [Tetrabaena socialis]|eukprot:PNH06824.1 Cytochrome P450 52A1 [Tetrabaena socialis]